MSNSPYTLEFREIDRTKGSSVGGKGANLGELCRIKDIKVPEGFCLTTEVFKTIIRKNTEINELLDRLTLLNPDNRKEISETSAQIRKVIEQTEIPRDLEKEILRNVEKLGASNAFAVRSSATAEDLPSASFAGQQDTYLNIIGQESILEYISKCWASLFTDRAVAYRIENHFDHRKVELAIVVQKMVLPQVSGIMFTADPITGNRKVISIDSSFGLGDALVSGLVTADNYKVRDDGIVDKNVSAKKLAVYASSEGGTTIVEIEAEHQNQQALTDNQILQLYQIGRKIEQHFGSPQDIEWCLSGHEFYIVQSRPISTLYPIPAGPHERRKENRVYVSVGHQQMMTDAIKPLGLSLWRLTAAREMFPAGGRLFVDITDELTSPENRNILLNVLGKSDPLIKDALTTITERGDFIKLLSGEKKEKIPGHAGGRLPNFQVKIESDPLIVPELIRKSQGSIEQLKQIIGTKSGVDLIEFILEDIQLLKKSMADPESFAVIMTAMNASSWINEKMNEWLGEINAADTLSQSLTNNITSEMGMELLDVADVIRAYPEVVDYLERVDGDDFLNGLENLRGGMEAKAGVVDFLRKYGMRCPGEIDITKDRWSEKPETLAPLILSNIRNNEPKASKRKFEQGLEAALKKEKDLLERLLQLPEGVQKAEETKEKIDLIRNFAGYREYPKYAIVTRYFVYKKALLKEAEALVKTRVIKEKEDVYYLNFNELHDLFRSKKLDYNIIEERKKEFRLYEKLTPPRVITSDGEIISGRYKREDLPADAILGLPVSSGIIEGRARVILRMDDADLEKGDILVTTFTDPSWTPLFVSIAGLVTEVGGLMTHGAVIAREYGLPAIVGVDNATHLIKDGQRIRVNGTEGYIEIL